MLSTAFSSTSFSPPPRSLSLSLHQKKKKTKNEKQDQPGGGGRFVESYKKQFREQEARSLRERVAPRRRRKKEGGLFLSKVGNGGGSGNGGGGGGVFGGVLGALVGRAAEAETENDSSSSAELFLPPECECLAAVEVAEEEEEEGEEEEEEGERSSSGGENAPPSPSTSSLSTPSSSVVLGALDLRPPRSAGGGHPAGVPPSDEAGCAVLNVAVHPSARRRGVARALLSSAAEIASSRWAATALYTTVAATNAGARALYADFGFVEVVAAAARGEGVEGDGEGSSLPATTLVGRELLLRAEL